MVRRGAVRLYLTGTLQLKTRGESDRLSDSRGGERVGRIVDCCEVLSLACGCSQRPILQVVGSDCLWDAGCGGLLDTRWAGAGTALRGGERCIPVPVLCVCCGGERGGDLVHCICGPSLALCPGLPG